MRAVFSFQSKVEREKVTNFLAHTESRPNKIAPRGSQRRGGAAPRCHVSVHATRTIPNSVGRGVVQSLCTRFPHAHGAPIHVGDPAQIGITDLTQPDWGEAVEIRSDELPVFWACGVTPQAALLEVKPDLCITHTPGRMLLTKLSAEA